MHLGPLKVLRVFNETENYAKYRDRWVVISVSAWLSYIPWSKSLVALLKLGVWIMVASEVIECSFGIGSQWWSQPYIYVYDRPGGFENKCQS